MIIDAHMHIGAWDHADFLGRSATLDQALAVLDESGMHGAAIMPTDRCDNAGLLAQARAQIAAGYAGALWMFAWVRPQASGAASGASQKSDQTDQAGELAWVRQHHDSLTGIKIHPSLSRMRITDAGFAPALDLAEERDLVVLVHCGRWQEIASYRFAIEAARTRPRLRFVLAHAGGDTPPLASQAADMVADTGVDNVWFEISGLREYWVIERNVARIGAHRYLLGSDFCLAHPRMYLGAIAGMSLTARQKARILGHNARELFGAPLG